MGSLEVILEDGVDVGRVLREAMLSRAGRVVLKIRAHDAPSAMERLREHLLDSYPFTLVVEVVK
uniref:Uncharacterized protein n=1 Tax=Thermofilum pendens TaxID=2269 RepID=A0A7J3X6R5_THEPE